MHARIVSELSLEAGRNVVASVGDAVAEKDKQLVYTVVAQAVKAALEMYEVRMEWAGMRQIPIEQGMTNGRSIERRNEESREHSHSSD